MIRLGFTRAALGPGRGWASGAGRERGQPGTARLLISPAHLNTFSLSLLCLSPSFRFPAPSPAQPSSAAAASPQTEQGTRDISASLRAEAHSDGVIGAGGALRKTRGSGLLTSAQMRMQTGPFWVMLGARGPPPSAQLCEHRLCQQCSGAGAAQTAPRPCSHRCHRLGDRH